KTNAVQVVVSLNIVTTRNHANFSPVDDVVNANPGTRLPGSPITVRRERWAAHALILEPDLQLLSLAHIPNANAFGRQRCDSSAVGRECEFDFARMAGNDGKHHFPCRCIPSLQPAMEDPEQRLPVGSKGQLFIVQPV